MGVCAYVCACGGGGGGGVPGGSSAVVYTQQHYCNLFTIPDSAEPVPESESRVTPLLIFEGCVRKTMAQVQQYVFRYQSFHISKSQPLGHGSYGAVYKAKCDQLPCAAKVLHPTILDPADPGAGKIMNRFQQECAFLESIRHPNIVQYLGMTRDPESRLPVLLMELLDENLTKMLERSQQSLAYYVQVDICHDIALAVAHLHSNDIIHRDLSSNNVLMIAGRRAKVTDFGMSKLAGAAPNMTPLTMCPGTLAYMPPEALREPPRYTKKLDCFSEGVIMIQVCTRLWPEPGPRTQIIQDSRSLTGIMEMPVPEMQRRKNHIDLIDPDHALLSIITNSLKFQDKDRPSSEELCQRLAGLKDTREYRESVQTHYNEIQAKDRQIEDKDRLLQQRATENASLTQQLQEQRRLHQEEISLQERQLRKEISSRERQLREEISARERQLQEEISAREGQERQLNQQLEEQEQAMAEFQQTNHSLQRQVEQLQQQQSLNPLLQVDHKPHPHSVREMSLNWRDGDKAPSKIIRGTAVMDGDMAYFLHKYGDVCSYDSCSKKWRKLPECPCKFSSLAIVNGQLIAIGGYSLPEYYTNKLLCLQTECKEIFPTNKLLSLQTEWKEIFPPMTIDKLLNLHTEWKENSDFPPMPTKRSTTVVVTTKEHLIVAGGCCGGSITTVEVMDTKNLVWSTVASLPHPYHGTSVTICGDQLHMLGGEDDKGKTKSVLTCSLTELLQSSPSSSSIWHRVADAPAYRSTCAAVNGELLAVGGCDKDDKPSSAVHEYNPTTNSWDFISNMPTARFFSFVAVLPTNEMVVVGGCDGSYGTFKTVEIATNNEI